MLYSKNKRDEKLDTELLKILHQTIELRLSGRGIVSLTVTSCCAKLTFLKRWDLGAIICT